MNNHDNKSTERFIKSFKSKNNIPLDNVYVFSLEDENGNIVDEKYGVNLVVKQGFSRLPVRRNDGYAYLRIGNGNGAPSSNDTNMFNYLGQSSSSGTWLGTLSPLYYDSERDLICQYQSILRFVFDYTYLNQTFNITEFGIYNTQYSQLITHGLILDGNGDPSYITKELYQKLTVTVLFLYSAKPEVYRRLINSDIYGVMPVIWPATISGSGESGDYENIYCRFESDKYYPYNSEQSSTTQGWRYIYGKNNKTVSQNALIKTHTDWLCAPSHLCERSYEYVGYATFRSDFYYESKSYHSFLCIKPVTGDEETLSSTEVYCSNPCSNSLESMFQSMSGAYDSVTGTGRFPVTNFEIKSSRMYNVEDHDWTIVDNVTSCEDSEFGSIYWRYNAFIYTNNPNGDAIWAHIYTNNNIDVQITKFGNSGITLYAADEWWDNTTWILITNLSNLTLEQGTKRYYILESNTYATATVLYPTRDQDYPRFIYDKTYRVSTTKFDDDTSDASSVPPCVSDEYELFCTMNYMVFHPEGMSGGYDTSTAAVTKSLAFKWDSSVIGTGSYSAQYSKQYRHIFDDKLVLCSGWYGVSGSSNTSGTHIRIIDISDSTINMNSSVTNPYIDLQINFTNTNRSNAGTIVHWWDDDYWFSYEPNAKELIAIQIHGTVDPDTPEQTMIDSGVVDWSPVYGSKIMAYRKSTYEFSFYDLQTTTAIRTVNIQDFDSSVTTISGYAGYNGILYITASYGEGNNMTFFYDISNDLWNVDASHSTNAFGRTKLVGYVDKCVMFAVPNSAELVLIDANNPYTLMQESGSHFPYNPNQNNKPIAYELKYINNGKQLVARITENYYKNSSWYWDYICILDIGRILDEGEFYQSYTQSFYYRSDKNALLGSAIYKDCVVLRVGENQVRNCFNIMPISNFLPHKMTITTNTISGFNNPFKIPDTPFFSPYYGGSTNKLLMDPCDANTKTYCTIYRIDMYESSLLSHRLVPCVRDLDSMIGLYDTVSNEFLEPLENDSMSADTSTTITDDYGLPSGYTQVYSISHNANNVNWITTAQMSTPVIHTQNTKIEWYGKASTSGGTLFGSMVEDNSANNRLVFKVTSTEFQYTRGSTNTYSTSGLYDTDMKLVCEGLTATWYAMSDTSTPVGSITIPNGVLDDGEIPMAFMTIGRPNGYDYTSPNP